MCRIYDVADFFIDYALDDDENHMTNMRINKLMYFAQGWSLARTGKPLFNDDFQAWPHGPVAPAVYHKFKYAGSSKIKRLIDDNYADNITGDEQRLLLDVIREYDQYSTSGLVVLSHKQDSPWDKAIKRGKGTKIEKNDMMNYFKTMPELKSFTMPKFTECDFVGHRDVTTGNYVLPKDWSDD